MGHTPSGSSRRAIPSWLSAVEKACSRLTRACCCRTRSMSTRSGRMLWIMALNATPSVQLLPKSLIDSPYFLMSTDNKTSITTGTLKATIFRRHTNSKVFFTICKAKTSFFSWNKISRGFLGGFFATRCSMNVGNWLFLYCLKYQLYYLLYIFPYNLIIFFPKLYSVCFNCMFLYCFSASIFHLYTICCRWYSNYFHHTVLLLLLLYFFFNIQKQYFQFNVILVVFHATTTPLLNDDCQAQEEEVSINILGQDTLCPSQQTLFGQCLPLLRRWAISVHVRHIRHLWNGFLNLQKQNGF